MWTLYSVNIASFTGPHLFWLHEGIRVSHGPGHEATLSKLPVYSYYADYICTYVYSTETVKL